MREGQRPPIESELSNKTQSVLHDNALLALSSITPETPEDSGGGMLQQKATKSLQRLHFVTDK